jgi:hypothetical protein
VANVEKIAVSKDQENVAAGFSLRNSKLKMNRIGGTGVSPVLS